MKPCKLYRLKQVREKFAEGNYLYISILFGAFAVWCLLLLKGLAYLIINFIKI